MTDPKNSSSTNSDGPATASEPIPDVPTAEQPTPETATPPASEPGTAEQPTGTTAAAPAGDGTQDGPAVDKAAEAGTAPQPDPAKPETVAPAITTPDAQRPTDRGVISLTVATARDSLERIRSVKNRLTPQDAETLAPVEAIFASLLTS